MAERAERQCRRNRKFRQTSRREDEAVPADSKHVPEKDAYPTGTASGNSSVTTGIGPICSSTGFLTAATSM